MGMQHILWVVSLLLFIHQATSIPVTLPARASNPYPLKTKKNIEALQENYKGIWFQSAAETCSDEDFNTLVNTLPLTLGFLEGKQREPRHKTPGWNRFFMADHNVPKGEGWASRHNREYENIMYAFDLATKFPSQGRLSVEPRPKKSNRISLACRSLEVKKTEPGQPTGTHCDWSFGLAAFTTESIWTDMGYSSVVTFCPRFFRDQTVNGKTYPTIKDLRTLTRGRKQTEQDLINLLTREHVFAHELFHCEKATKMGFHIEDVYDEIPTVYVPGTFPRVRSVKVYGAPYCAMYAWKNTRTTKQNKWRLNPRVSENADSYAWLLTFNWFNDVYGWNSDGSFHWNLKDELKRNQPGPNSIVDYSNDHYPDFEHNPATVINGSSINLQQLPARPNCHQVGGNPLDLDCEIFGWYQPPPSTTTPSGPPPPPPSPLVPPPAPAAVPATENPLYQIIIGLRVSYLGILFTPSNSWAYWTPDVGAAPEFCNGPMGEWTASSDISLKDVPNPTSHTFTADVNGFSGCSYTASAGGPGTFNCDGWQSPIKCTNGVHHTLHGDNHGCPSPLGTPHDERPKVICQWGDPPPGPPKPSPTSQVIIGFKTWGSSYHGTDQAPNHKYWEAWTPDLGHSPEFCHGPVAKWEAPMDIHVKDVPYPASHVFDVTLNGVSGCSYQGDSDKPGKFSCPGWSSSVQCTNGVHATLHECAGSNLLGGGWRKMRPKLICQW